jgi:transportin-3
MSADVKSGVTVDIQSQVFQCLRSWVNAGEIMVGAVSQTALLQFSFQALSSPDLFDSAVDLICDLIHETQEVFDNEDVIKDLLPKIINLRSHLREAVDDSDKFRGYTRIFAEAGETYRQLIVQHPDTFYPIVEAIAECTSYKDLDIVPITFHFWYRLAQSIGKQNAVSQVFQQAYAALMQIIILHLHFPPESAELSGQEADDFRAFRHFMGDTLKDCCYVLGSGICLNKAYEMIKAGLTEGSGGGNVPWQAIEAPLFAMRSMGAEVDFREDKIIPLIMDLLPNLPNHPRIHYAAILVVSRYTEWINLHPTYIPFLLSYLSSGFENPESEETAAAAQAMKYLCRDCRKVRIVLYCE